MDVVMFGQQNWDVCWTGKQQLATRLARRGHRLLYVDPDLDVDTPLRDAARSLAPLASGLALREEAPRCWRFTPPYSPLLRWRLSVRRHPRVLRACLRRLGLERAICLALHPRALAGTRLAPFAARVYYAVDDNAAFGGLSEPARRRLREQEEALLRESDLALAISPRLYERLRRAQPRIHLLPSGADVGHFAPVARGTLPPDPALARLPRPVLGFVGQVDERLDQPLLTALADARPGWSFVLVGRQKAKVDLAPLRARPHVHRLGHRPFADLPRLLAGMDVCLVPFRRTDLTEASSPLKVYDYLAAGRPVVSTPLAGLGPCRDVVSVAATPAGFLAAVERALRDPAAEREARLAVARAHDWERRVDALERHLAEALGCARRRPPGAAPIAAESAA